MALWISEGAGFTHAGLSRSWTRCDRVASKPEHWTFDALVLGALPTDAGDSTSASRALPQRFGCPQRSMKELQVTKQRWVRVAAPEAKSLRVDSATVKHVPKLTLWFMREMFLQWRGLVAVGGIAVLCYLVVFGLPLDLLGTDWETLFESAANELWGIPWAQLARLAATAVVRSALSVLIATLALTVLVALRWVILVRRPSTGVYASPGGASVLTLDVFSRGDELLWLVGRHLAGRKHRSNGSHLRESIRSAVIADFAHIRLTIRARVRNERVRVLLQRQFPTVRVRGDTIEATPHELTLGDHLGRHTSPATLATAVRSRAESDTRGTVTALVAPWGAGKSWILNRAVALLEFPSGNEQSVRVVEFNPWLFADQSSLFAGFCDVVLGEVRGLRARRKVARALKLIGPASKFGPVDVQPAATVIGGMLEPASSPSSVFRALDRAMARAKQPICIVMDDVDRLTPDELIMLFKLIRLVGNLRGVSYLLAMDEDTVLHLIGSTDIANSSPERARMYLEKIIDFKHRVPPLTFEQIHDRGLGELLRFADLNKISVHQRSSETLEWVFGQSLSRRLTTVRALDRLLAEVRSISPTLFGEVDFKDWCLAAFLRSQMPQVWTYVVEHKSDFLGKRSSLSIGMATDAENQFDANLPSALRNLDLSDEGVGIAIDVLRAMFPAISPDGGSIMMSRSTAEESEFRLGIGHGDYFDRYTWIGLPPSDVSDKEILRLLRALTGEDASDGTRGELLAIYEHQPSTVLDRMRRNQDTDGVDKLALFQFLASILPARNNVASLFARDRSPIVLAAGQLMVALNEDEMNSVFAWATDDEGQADQLFCELLQRRGYFWHSSSPIEARMQRAQVPIVARLRARLSATPCPTIEDFPLWDYAMNLKHIDEVEFRKLALERIADGAWRADDLVALFVSTFVPREAATPLHTGISEKRLLEVLGDEMVLDLYPVNDVRIAPRDCLAHEGNQNYVDSDVSTMRETAAGAVAQVARKLDPDLQTSSSG